MSVNSAKSNVVGSNRLVNLRIEGDHIVVAHEIGSQNYKDYNEDCYWPFEQEINQYQNINYSIAGRLYIVADGVSGSLDGRQASLLATQIVSETFYNNIKQLDYYPDDSDLELWLRVAIFRANRKLLDESKKQRLNKGLVDCHSYLQTTLTCALLRGQSLIVASVGDSHLYRLRKDKKSICEISLLSANDPRSKPRFIGTNLESDDVTIYNERLHPEDVLLLCSDGLYKNLTSDHSLDEAQVVIAKIYEDYVKRNESIPSRLNAMCGRLLKLANDPQTGGRDNITAMLIEVPSLTAHQQSGITTLNLKLHNNVHLLAIAQKLYSQLGLDFEKNKKIVEQLLVLFDQDPSQDQLKELMLNAIIDLANLVTLLPDKTKPNRKLWETWQILSFFNNNYQSKLKFSERSRIEQTLKVLIEHLDSI